MYIVVVLLRMRNEMWESCRSFTYVEIVAQLGRIVSVYKNVTTIYKNISCIIPHVFYCDKTCQKRDWRHHKPECAWIVLTEFELPAEVIMSICKFKSDREV